MRSVQGPPASKVWLNKDSLTISSWNIINIIIIIIIITNIYREDRHVNT